MDLTSYVTCFQDGGYTSVDLASSRLSEFLDVVFPWQYCMRNAGRLVGLPKSTVKLINFKNSGFKAMSACAPDSFILLKYYMHAIRPPRPLYTSVCIYCSLNFTQMFKNLKKNSIIIQQHVHCNIDSKMCCA